VTAPAGDGHLQGVEDELGPEVVRERLADDPAAVEVHHR
jgi:hypothetical protein